MQAKERKENRLEGHGYIDDDDDDVSSIVAPTVSMCLQQREKPGG